MSELDDFLTTTLPRQAKAQEAIHNGDPTPWLEMWSTQDPVTLFGAWTSKRGWDEVSQFIRGLATRFSNGSPQHYDLLAAEVSGDLAYTVSIERSTVSVDGRPVQPDILRVTHIFRREHGEWRIVHRHGDSPPIEQGPPAEASTK